MPSKVTPDAADYSWGINVVDLTDSDFGIFTEADQAMLDYACTVGADEHDYSPFYVEDDE